MRKNVVILGIVLMAVGALLFFSGLMAQTAEQALGWLIIGLPLGLFLLGLGFIFFLVGLIMRKVVPVRVES